MLLENKSLSIFNTISFYKITDFNQNVYFLFKKSDITTLSTDIKKTYGLYERYYTDTLYLNDKIYHINVFDYKQLLVTILLNKFHVIR